MTKKHKHKKTIDKITDQLATQCQITPKEQKGSPKKKSSKKTPTKKTPEKPPGKIVLYDEVDPLLLAKWPKIKLKVPPIFLHKPTLIDPHVKKILQMGIKFYQPRIGKNFTRVICETFEDHKNFVLYLEKKQLPYHTFGHPSKRKMKVIIRGVPINSDLINLKEELKSLSIPIIRMHRLRTRIDIRDTTMIVLAVVPYDDVGKNILKIKEILGSQVVLEPPIDKPRQCYRCQKWGHSQRYCHALPRCVKCAGEHLSKKCDKKFNEEPTCVNCGEEHTASYKKCKYAHGPFYYEVVQSVRLLIPSFKPNVIVTLDNYINLYKNRKYKNENKEENKEINEKKEVKDDKAVVKINEKGI